MNPPNKFGNIFRCIICDSKIQYANQSLYANSKHSANVTEEEEEEKEECEEVELVLMSVNKQEVFVAEAGTSAVVDTACTKTVTGDEWLEDYIACLQEEEERTIEY